MCVCTCHSVLTCRALMLFSSPFPPAGHLRQGSILLWKHLLCGVHGYAALYPACVGVGPSVPVTRSVCCADLTSYEVNFGYKEAGVQKNALVKVRVCPACALKMFHRCGRFSSPPLGVSRVVSRDPPVSHSHSHTHTRSKVKEIKKREAREEKEKKKEAKKKRRRDGEAAPGKDGKLDEEGEGEAAAAPVPAPAPPGPKSDDAAKLWSAEVVKEPTRQDDFEDYFKDMFQ